MNYTFRNTYRLDNDTYIEDRGYAHVVGRDDADFETLDAEFSAILALGQSARRGMNGEEWEIIEGFPLLDLMKERKHAELNAAFDRLQTEGTTLQSSLGFAIDAHDRANRDVRGLLDSMPANGLEKTSFCAADNSFHEITLEQVKTLQLELIAFGQKLYARKWALREAIARAQSPAELDAIDINLLGD